jgi:PAS domain-containing protein
MPETIRTANERLRSRPRRGGFLVALVNAYLCIAFGTPARAEASFAFGVDAIQRAVAALGRQEIATLTLTLGLLCFAVLAAVVLVRTRKAADRIETVSRHGAMELHAEIDRLKALLLAQPQVLVAWAAGADEPEILGDTTIIVPGGVSERVLAFGSWLEPAAAQRMERAVETLRAEGRGFVMTLTTASKRPIEAEGRAVGGSAILRLRDVGGIERELMDLAARHDKLMSDVETMKALLDSLPAPVWARDGNGRLIFVNQAYARAVEAEDSTDAVARE